MDGRARRAVPLIAAAVAAVVVTSLLYLRSEVRPAGGDAQPSPSASPVPHLAGTYTPAFDFIDPTHGWALVVDYGPQHRFWIFVTNDGAQHWHRQFSAIALGGQTYLRFFDMQHGFAYAGTVYRTVDGGADWTPVQMPSDGPQFTFASATRGWFMPSMGAVPPHLYTTDDGGLTWTAVDTPIPGGATDFAFRADGEGWLGAGVEAPEVFLTEDGGQSWRTISLPIPASGFNVYTTSVRVLPGHAVIALVGSDAGFVGAFYSDDLGATWSAVEPLPQPEWLVDASFVDDTHWWVARYGFLYKTSDAGISWTRVLVEKLPAGWNIQPANVIDVDHGWWTMIETTDSRDWALMMTSDGGTEWRTVNMPQPG